LGDFGAPLTIFVTNFHAAEKGFGTAVLGEGASTLDALDWLLFRPDNNATLDRFGETAPIFTAFSTFTLTFKPGIRPTLLRRGADAFRRAATSTFKDSGALVIGAFALFPLRGSFAL
jgi:hypothetical protein